MGQRAYRTIDSIAGFAYDRTGDYRLVFDILAMMTATGSVFFILARKPGPPKRAAKPYNPYVAGAR